MNATTAGPAVRAILERVDEAWAAFHDAIRGLPPERLEMHVAEGEWTRKQMLSHITAWHELTSERLIEFVDSGEPVGTPEEEDAFNARIARSAVGRTAGEVLLSLDDSFRKLRRDVGRLTDAQLAAHDGWASAIIAGNTYDHYVEHLADLGVKRA